MKKVHLSLRAQRPPRGGGKGSSINLCSRTCLGIVEGRTPARPVAPWVCIPAPGRHGGRPSRSGSTRSLTLSWRGGLPHALSHHGSPSRNLHPASCILHPASWRGGLPHALSCHGSASQGPGRHGGRPSRSCLTDWSRYPGGAGSCTPCHGMGLHPGTRPSRRPALQVLSDRLVALSWRGGLLHALSHHGSPSRNLHPGTSIPHPASCIPHPGGAGSRTEAGPPGRVLPGPSRYPGGAGSRTPCLTMGLHPGTSIPHPASCIPHPGGAGSRTEAGPPGPV